MKKYSKLLATLCFAALVVLASCGGGGDDTPDTSVGEAQANLLEGTWTVTEVSFDGISRIDTWGTNFTLTISGVAEGTDGIWGGNYATDGKNVSQEPDANTVWPGSGSWAFLSASSVQAVNRGPDDIVVSISSATINSLILTFTIADPTATSARSAGVFDAQWRFEFSKPQE